MPATWRNLTIHPAQTQEHVMMPTLSEGEELQQGKNISATSSLPEVVEGRGVLRVVEVHQA